MTTARISLAEQLKQISETAPVGTSGHFDPEDVHLINPQEQQTDISAAREHYLDVGPSALRKLHQSVSDPKYSATRISRQQLVESDRDSDDQSGVETSDQEDDLPVESPFEEDRPESRSASPQIAPRGDDDLASNIRKTRDQDRLKGIAVSRQITLWDSLLDARIRLQKGVSTSNRLPLPADHSQFATDTDAVDKMLSEAMLLSEELFLLQEHLLEKNEDITPPPRKRRRTDMTSDHATFVSEATHSVSELESVYHPHLIRTLSKWSSKIQSVAPSVLLPSNRNAFSKNSRDVKNAVQLIDDMVTDQKEWNKLVGRTRVWRNKGVRMGGEVMEEQDEEVFDDTDFYQQLLRDVIDSRNGERGGQDWMAAQKERKKKKNVDTKASKGRKLRFEVHEKVQNFMVPVPVHNGWHEEQIDELFASLLGKGFETANPEPVVELQPGSFRIFG